MTKEWFILNLNKFMECKTLLFDDKFESLNDREKLIKILLHAGILFDVIINDEDDPAPLEQKAEFLQMIKHIKKIISSDLSIVNIIKEPRNEK